MTDQVMEVSVALIASGGADRRGLVCAGRRYNRDLEQRVDEQRLVVERWRLALQGEVPCARRSSGSNDS